METGIREIQTHMQGKTKSISRRYVMIPMRTLKGEGIRTCLQNEGILIKEARHDSVLQFMLVLGT